MLGRQLALDHVSDEEGRCRITELSSVVTKTLYTCLLTVVPGFDVKYPDDQSPATLLNYYAQYRPVIRTSGTTHAGEDETGTRSILLY